MKYPSLFNSLNDLLNFDQEWDNFMPTPHIKNYGWQEQDHSLCISFDMPGLKKEEIKIETSDQLISVSGVRELKNGTNSFKKQYRYQTYIPDTVNVDQIEASLADGVLTLTAPKSNPVSKNKTIAIK